MVCEIKNFINFCLLFLTIFSASSTVFANEGGQALDQLRNHPDIDLVLSDINMPGMDGLTLLQRVPEINPVVKVVIVSAYGDMDNIREAMNRGAFDFLTKPIDFADLEKTIEKTSRQDRKSVV